MFNQNNQGQNQNKKVESGGLFNGGNNISLFNNQNSSGNSPGNPLFPGNNDKSNNNSNPMFPGVENKGMSYGSLFGAQPKTDFGVPNQKMQFAGKSLFNNPPEMKGLFGKGAPSLTLSQAILPGTSKNNEVKQISNPSNEINKSPIIGTNIQGGNSLFNKGINKGQTGLFGLSNPNQKKEQTNAPFGTMFGGSTGPSTSLFGKSAPPISLGLFSKPAQIKETTPTAPSPNPPSSSFFAGSTSLFGGKVNEPKDVPKVEKTQNQAEKKEDPFKKKPTQSLFSSSIPSSLFSDQPFKKPEETQGTKEQKPSLFAGISMVQPKAPANEVPKTSLPSLFNNPADKTNVNKEQKKKEQKKIEQPKKQSLFGPLNPIKAGQIPILAPPTAGLFKAIPKTSQSEPNKGMFSFGIKTDEKPKEVSQVNKPLGLNIVSPLKSPLVLTPTESIIFPNIQKPKTQLKASTEPNPLTFSIMIQSKNVTPQRPDSVFKQPKQQTTFSFAKPKDEGISEDNKQHRKTATTFQGTDIARETISNQGRNNPSFTIRSNQSSSLQSKPDSSVPRSRFIATIAKPNENPNTQIIDYRMLIHEENKESFPTFIVQYKEKIIKSMKQYFTLRKTEQKSLKKLQNGEQKQIFLIDLCNLLSKNLALDVSSFDILKHFIEKTLKEEKYDLKMFRQNKLNVEYFQMNNFYRADYNNSYCLNEDSFELQLLAQKLQTKWYHQLLGYIHFLSKYTDLFRLPSDLFLYMFKYLLELPNKFKESKSSSDRKTKQEEMQFSIRKQLISLISTYNKKLNSQYQLIKHQELIEIINFIESAYQHDDIVEIALKVVLNCIDFKKFKEFQTKVVSHILGTKSLGLLPLRTIIHKITQKHQEYVPYYVDLYKYVKGQEWVDWLDTYLNESKETHNLQPRQSQRIVECLCTIGQKTLKERLLQSKKGISKFFNHLKDENLVYLYYKLLQNCIYDENSIREIDEFYFKKMRFKLQYQEIITYVINFNENLGNQDESFDILFPNLQIKLSLLIKIMIVQSESVKELQNWIFADAKSKKVKYNDENNGNRQGQKIIHLLIDIITIISVKKKSTHIITKIFKLLNKLIRSKDTQNIVLKVLRCNKPVFSFYDEYLNIQTTQAISEFLQSIISGNYIYELITFYEDCKEEEAKMSDSYLFRYNDSEYERIQKENKGLIKHNHFSIYWFHQVIKVLSKQDFNPYLLTKIFEKLYIIPYNHQMDSQLGNSRLIKTENNAKDSQIPIILANIIETLNNCSIWENISRLFQYKFVRQSGKIKLINKYIQTQNNNLSKKTIYFTLKLLKTIFNLYSHLLKHKNNATQHWIIKVLDSINVINNVRLNNYSSNYFNKGNHILFSLFAIYHLEHKLHNDSIRNVQWQSETTINPNKHQFLLNYLNKNKESLDFNVIQNHLTVPNTIYYENENNITTLSLDVITLITKIYPELNIQFTLTNSLPISKDQQVQKFKNDIIDDFAKVLIKYLSGKYSQGVEYKVLNLIYTLKEDGNKNNSSLSNRLFVQCLKSKILNDKTNVRIQKIIIKYLIEQTKSKSTNFLYESHLQKYILSFLTNLQLKDNVMRNSYTFKQIKQIGKMINNYKNKTYHLYNLHQLERIIQEKNIINIAEHMDILALINQYFIHQIMNKRNSASLNECMRTYNAIVIHLNLIFCQKDIPAESHKYYHPETSSFNEEYPRMYIRDPIEYFISDYKNINKAYIAQDYQKINIIEWFYDKIVKLSTSITKYFKLILSIHHYFYSNNPISYTTDRNDLKNLDLFSHLALGKVGISSIELFGTNNNTAVDLVQILSEKIINRLGEIKNKLNQDSPAPEIFIFYKDNLSLLVSCFQWLRNKERYGENALKKLISIVWKNVDLFMPNHHEEFFSSEAIKVLISSLSIISEPLDKKILKKIHKIILHQLSESLNEHNRICIQEQGTQNLNILTQLSVTLLQLIPPQKIDDNLLQMIVNVWSKESNYQFFFNESKLILRLCSEYPEEIVKLKPLLKCEILNKHSSEYSKYEEQERKFDGITWLWLLKISIQLLKGKGSLSIFAINQVNAFFQKYKQRIANVLKMIDLKVSKAHVQELELVLELLISLFSHHLWASINRSTIQELTYTLSHKTILFFIGLTQGNVSFLINSRNQKMMSLVKPFNSDEEDSILNISYQNMHELQMKLKINKCLRNYCILMKFAFRSSHYVQKYFDNYVTDKTKYYAIFWETFNKNLICLYAYANKQLKQWKSLIRYNDFMKLLNQCYNSPYTFVQNGYLSSIIDIPATIGQAIEDVYLLIYVLSDLSIIHFLKQKVYISKESKHLSSQLELFCKKLKDNLLMIKKELGQANANYMIKGQHFERLLELVQIRYIK